MGAEEENIPASEATDVTLDQVLSALDELGVGRDAHPLPTTHG
jgi:hypothetical protein